MKTGNKQKKTKGDGFDSLFEILEIAFEQLIKCIYLILIKIYEEILRKYFKCENLKQPVLEKDLLIKKTSKNTDSIGFSPKNKRDIVFSDYPMHRHTQIFGGSGFGKTTFIFDVINNGLKNNIPTIFIEAKVTAEAVDHFTKICEFHKRRALVVYPGKLNNVKINPLKGHTDMAQVMNIITTSFAFPDGIASIYSNTTKSLLAETVLPSFAKEGREPSLKGILNKLKQLDNDSALGLIAELGYLLSTPYGDIFGGDEESLSIYDVIYNKENLYVGLGTNGYGEDVKKFAKILITSLQVVSHNIGQTDISFDLENNPTNLFIDEAGSILYPNFINLLNKGRSSGFRMFLSTQAMSDYTVIGENFADQVFNNCGNIVAFCINRNSAAQEISGAIGTYLTTKTTTALQDGEDSGRQSIRETMEYIIHPNIIKNLKPGQCIMATKAPNQVFLINVNNYKLLPALQKSLEVKIKIRPSIKTNRNPAIEAEMNSRIDLGNKVEAAINSGELIYEHDSGFNH